MNEYRYTFPRYYPEGSRGFDDLSARQGHYIKANNFDDLRDKIRGCGISHGTVAIQLWYENGNWVGSDESMLMYFYD